MDNVDKKFQAILDAIVAIEGPGAVTPMSATHALVTPSVRNMERIVDTFVGFGRVCEGGGYSAAFGLTDGFSYIPDDEAPEATAARLIAMAREPGLCPAGLVPRAYVSGKAAV